MAWTGDTPPVPSLEMPLGVADRVSSGSLWQAVPASCGPSSLERRVKDCPLSPSGTGGGVQTLPASRHLAAQRAQHCH